MDINNITKVLCQYTSLYRYDLGNDTPKDWSTDFHSIEYDTCRGYKNVCGAFFFFDNIATAKKIGELARKGTAFKTNTLTSCHTIKDLKFLDLSIFSNPSNMIYNLCKCGFDIFNKGFLKYGIESSEDVSIDNIKKAFEIIKNEEINNNESVDSNTLITEIIRCSQQINIFFNDTNQELAGLECRYISQLLTDFNNGPIFKNMLLEKGFDGYCFREVPTSLTYCIFDSQALTSPIREK